MRRSSAETKAVILAAAKERFAESGFERATIRAIAADANIDPSMVMRYFGSKDQLFAAAADFDLQLPDLSAEDRADIGARVVDYFMDRWERDEALIVLLRSSTSNDARTIAAVILLWMWPRSRSRFTYAPNKLCRGVFLSFVSPTDAQSSRP